MSTTTALQRAFGSEATIEVSESIHPHSEVHRCRVHAPGGDIAGIVKRTWGSEQKALEEWQRALVASGVPTVAPLLPAVSIDVDDELQSWVAYPYLAGRAWDGGTDDLAAAGRLLGRIHSASWELSIDGFPEIEWGNPARESIDEDRDAIAESAARHWPHADTDRWRAQLDVFGTETLPLMRTAEKVLPVSLDHRAANLLFDDADALMVDLENAALAPRILDLALAVLLFPLEHRGSRGRALSRDEWLTMLDGYLDAAPDLDETERSLWPIALTYMKLEWGTWHLTEGVETDPANLGFLEDLLTLDEHARYALR